MLGKLKYAMGRGLFDMFGVVLARKSPADCFIYAVGHGSCPDTSP